MNEFIKTLSAKTEFILVISLAFGFSILNSIILFLDYFVPLVNYQPSFDNPTLIFNVFIQLVIISLIYFFLKLRDRQIDLSNNLNIFNVSLICAGLIITYYISYILLASVAFLGNSSSENQVFQNSNLKLTFIPILLFSASNSFFEETIVTGYIISTLEEKRNAIFALNISVFIRLMYHLYQGPVAVLHIVPMGIIFGVVYIKYKNIWPLVIAHFILDLIALSQYSH